MIGGVRVCYTAIWGGAMTADGAGEGCASGGERVWIVRRSGWIEAAVSPRRRLQEFSFPVRRVKRASERRQGALCNLSTNVEPLRAAWTVGRAPPAAA